MYFDSNTAKIFKAYTLFMQQQQSNDCKEVLATKALQVVVNKFDQFEGKNIFKYLRCYVQKIELNCIFEKEMIQLFELIMVAEIRNI